MRATIALMRRARLGRTAENPAVGALVVRDGVIVGQGWTQDGGRPLRTVAYGADRRSGARRDIYVSRNPAVITEKSPPCAEAIIAAGVKRVVSALSTWIRASPAGEPRHAAGRGVDVVRRARREALRILSDYVLRVTQGRPTVTLKLAETLDGYAAGDQHDPRLSIIRARQCAYACNARHARCDHGRTGLRRPTIR